MLKLDLGRPVTLGAEADVDATRTLHRGVVPKVAVEVPGDRQVAGRVPREHHAPLALAAVGPELIPTASHTGLEDRCRHGRVVDVMLGWPPGAHLLGEDPERTLEVDGDADREAHRSFAAETTLAGPVGRFARSAHPTPVPLVMQLSGGASALPSTRDRGEIPAMELQHQPFNARVP